MEAPMRTWATKAGKAPALVAHRGKLVDTPIGVGVLDDVQGPWAVVIFGCQPDRFHIEAVQIIEDDEFLAPTR